MPIITETHGFLSVDPNTVQVFQCHISIPLLIVTGNPFYEASSNEFQN